MRWPSRRARIALLGSLLLHAALAAFLFTRAPEPAGPKADAPLSIEIVETAPPRPSPPNPPAPSPAPRHAKHRAAQTTHASAAPPPAPVEPASRPVEGDLAHIDAPSVPPASHAPDLAAAATHAADRVAQTSLALNPPQPAEQDRSIQAPFVIADSNERISSMLREALGRSRVERGLVDPYFTQLGESMSNQWQAEKKVDEKGLGGFLKEMKRGLAEGASDYARAWAHAAEEYGRTGTIAGAGGPLDPDGRLADKIPAGFAEQLPDELRTTRIALVRLTQRPDGQLLAVELVQPSIDPEMDAEILRELRRGIMKLPVPPTSGQGIHDPIRSVWAFQLVVSIAPPAPMLGGSFDLDALFDKRVRQQLGGVGDVRLPLSRRISKHVELISVE